MIQYEAGQSVLVKNKAPEPPKHHTRKWKSWNRFNFNGEIVEVDERDDAILVKDVDSSNTVIEYRHQFRLPHTSVSITPKSKSFVEIG